MSAGLKRFTRWLPAVAWMAAIFLVSGDENSADHSSRIIGPVVRWVLPHLPQEQVDEVVFVVRKGAHVTEYAILAGLFWFALRGPRTRGPRPWSWKHAGIAFLLVVLYAASDEWHQTMVPNRYGVPTDVMIDTFGGMGGLTLLWLTGRITGRW